MSSDSSLFLVSPDVPIIYQYPVLPTGCEATSLTMLLQWSGLQLTKEQVADSLIKEPNAIVEDNGAELSNTSEICRRKAGGNPHRAFVGSPYDKESFGVFHEPIAQSLATHLPNKALDISGQYSFNEVLQIMKDTNAPVIVWITLELREPRVTDEWPDIQDPSTLVTWQSPEHCALMVGFDDEHVIINDPHTGQQEYYNRSLVEKRWNQLGCQAVTIKK